jgi:hypothetical protein
LNLVFELAVLAYGPCPVLTRVTEFRLNHDVFEFTEAVKKRKLDAVGKNSIKHPNVAGKKKVEIMKVAPSRGKANLKRPSAMEVASARPLKHSKKAMAQPAVTTTIAITTCVPAGSLGSKGAAGASGSKDMASAKKMAVHVHERYVPAIVEMAGASSKESQESSPHNLTARDSAPEIASRSDPRGQSSRASFPDSVPRLVSEASLQIIVPFGIDGASIPDVTTTITIG